MSQADPNDLAEDFGEQATTPAAPAEAGAVDALLQGGVRQFADDDGPREPLRVALGKWGVGPIAVLASVNLIDNLDRAVFITVAPDIRHAFGVSQATITGIAGISSILVVLAAFPFAVLADRGNRLRLAWFAASLWSVLTLLTGAVATLWQLGLTRIASGVGQAAIEPVHNSLLTDYYPARARGRVFSIHQLGLPVAGIIGPAFAGAIGAAFGWRWAFIAIAPIGLIAAFAIRRLQEPPRSGAHAQLEPLAELPSVVETTEQIPFRAGVWQLLSIPSLRSIYLAIGVLGFGLVSGPVLISDFFESQLHLGTFERGIVFAISGVGTLIGLIVGGVVADNLFRRNPAWSLYLAGIGLALFSVAGSVMLYLPLVLLVVVYVLASAGAGVVVAPMRQVVAAASPAKLTALAFAMLGIFILLFGGFFGGVIMGTIADVYSTRAALTLLVIPGVIAGLLVLRGARHVNADISRADEANRTT